jgi:hypothetical protein
MREIQLYVKEKSRGRGRGDHKRSYNIEMKEQRGVYLGAHSSVDREDHLLKNWKCNTTRLGSGGPLQCAMD